MKTVWVVVLILLTLLATSSGATKVLLMQQEVAFFGKFGFSAAALIAFGALQLIGGAMLPFRKTRLVGAAIVSVTFLVSLVLLMLDGNVAMSFVTAIVTVLLGVVLFRSWPSSEPPGP